MNETMTERIANIIRAITGTATTVAASVALLQYVNTTNLSGPAYAVAIILSSATAFAVGMATITTILTSAE